MKKILYITILVFVFSMTPIKALPWSDLAIGAKSAALGSAYSAVSGDIESLWYNPAGIAELRSISVMFSHLLWIGDINYEYLAFGMPIGTTMAWGASINYSYMKDNYIDESGIKGGTFTASNLVFDAGLAINLGRFDAGLSMKILSETLESQSDSGYAFDAGFIFHMIERYVDMGLTFRDFLGGATNSKTSVSNPSDFSVKIGALEKNFIKGIFLTQDYTYNPEYNTSFFNFGIQETFILNNIDLVLRAGYDMKGSQIGGAAGVSAGMGIRFNGFAIDYCFTTYDFAGNTHRFTLGYVFL